MRKNEEKVLERNLEQNFINIKERDNNHYSFMFYSIY